MVVFFFFFFFWGGGGGMCPFCPALGSGTGDIAKSILRYDNMDLCNIKKRFSDITK